MDFCSTTLRSPAANAQLRARRAGELDRFLARSIVPGHIDRVVGSYGDEVAVAPVVALARHQRGDLAKRSSPVKRRGHHRVGVMAGCGHKRRVHRPVRPHGNSRIPGPSPMAGRVRQRDRCPKATPAVQRASKPDSAAANPTLKHKTSTPVHRLLDLGVSPAASGAHVPARTHPDLPGRVRHYRTRGPCIWIRQGDSRLIRARRTQAMASRGSGQGCIAKPARGPGYRARACRRIARDRRSSNGRENSKLQTSSHESHDTQPEVETAILHAHVRAPRPDRGAAEQG